MKLSNGFKSIIAALILFTLMPMTVIPSSAMTPLPPTYLDGSNASGAEMPEGSAVVIENQSITFNLADFPAVNEAGSYSGNVQTEYTLFNPTDSEITLKIAYPLAETPTYYYGTNDTLELAKYSVMINGEPAEVTLRHGLNYNGDYLYDGFASLIFDEYIDNEFCGPDMTVTKYTFKQSDVEKSYAYVGFDVKNNEFSGRCLYLGEYARAWDKKDGDLRFNTIAGENGCTYELYVFGKDLTHLPEWKIYEYASVEDDEEIEGKIEFVSKESMTFSEYVFKDYDASLGISELDWFNMAATEISATIENGQVFTSLYGLNRGFADYRVSGFTYEISIGPGERVVNTLNAPTYPFIETKYDPYTFGYNYVLFHTNADMFTGKINVSINTPYYMIYDGNHSFEKTEDGYSIALDAVKILSENSTATLGSIFFILCEVEEPEEVEEKIPVIFWILIILAIPIIIIALIIEFAVNTVRNIFKLVKGER